MDALPFGKSSERVRRAGERVRDTAVGSAALAPPLLPGSVQTHRISEVSGERDAREDFLQGQKREPYSVRRMEMAVGGNGKSVDLGYVEKLMAASTTPSLSSLPTPAQLCRKRKNNQSNSEIFDSDGQRKECKRRASMREDNSNGVHLHLAQLRRKQRLCDLDSTLVAVTAQEVPSSPQQYLSAEENSLTLHGRTPFKDPHMARMVSGSSAVKLSFWQEEEEETKGESVGKAHSEPVSFFSLQSQQDRGPHCFELKQDFTVNKDHKPQTLEGGSSSCTWTRVRGSELSHEENEEQCVSGSQLGFRPTGVSLEKMWLSHTESLMEERGREQGSVKGGLKIHFPAEEYFEGVPFERPLSSPFLTVDQDKETIAQPLFLPSPPRALPPSAVFSKRQGISSSLSGSRNRRETECSTEHTGPHDGAVLQSTDSGTKKSLP